MKIVKRWDIVLTGLVFLFLVCAFYPHIVFFGEIFIKRDIGRYYLPLRLLTRRIFESGAFPFWNPYLFCGTPLFAGMQSCVLYPVSIICYLGTFSRMFSMFILFHIVLAGTFMYVLMREIRLSKGAAFLAAFTFAFSGYMISVINITISLSSVSWFPLTLFFYLKAIKEASSQMPGKLRWSVLTAFALLMMFLAGEPAVTFICVVILGGISCCLFLESIFEKKGFSFNYFKPFILSVSLFLLLSAFHSLPFIEFFRATDSKAMPWWVASGWSIPPSDLISLCLPFFNDIKWYFGNYWQVQSWLDNYYLGIIPLCLCAIGAFCDKSRKTMFLILFSVFSLLIALGKYSAFYPFLYKFFPCARFVRYPVRFFFLFTFCVSALCGIGLDYFRNHIKENGRPERLAKILLIASFICCLALGILISFSSQISGKLVNAVLPMIQDQDRAKDVSELRAYCLMDFYNLKRLLALFSLFGFLFFLGTKKRIQARPIVFILIGIAMVDILSTNLKYEAAMDAKDYAAPTKNIEFLKKDKSLFRIAVFSGTGQIHLRLPDKAYCEGVPAGKEMLVSNRMIEYGIYDIGSYDSMYLDRNNKLLGPMRGMTRPGKSRILGMLNVKYVYDTKYLKKGRYLLANATRYGYLFKNRNWQPRSYLSEKAVIIKKEEDIIKRLNSREFNPTQEVILEEDAPQSAICNVGAHLCVRPEHGDIGRTQGSAPTAGHENIQITSYKPNEVIIRTEVNSPKFLVLADSYYPGWKAYVDGSPTKIYRANFMLRAVYLPDRGRHIVKFAYFPFSFKLGCVISLLGAVAAVYVWNYKGNPPA